MADKMTLSASVIGLYMAVVVKNQPQRMTLTYIIGNTSNNYQALISTWRMTNESAIYVI